MNKRWPIFGVVLIFLLGILCGSLATHLLYRCRMDSITSGRGEHREELLVNRLERKLKLDDRQVVQVRSIVHETHEGIMALRRQLRPQTEAVIEKSQARINAILTPEQREKFAQMIAKHKEKMQKREW
jgi:hypothetical protein